MALDRPSAVRPARNCAVAAYRSSMQQLLPVRQRGSGACPDTRRSNKHCPTATLTIDVATAKGVIIATGRTEAESSGQEPDRQSGSRIDRAVRAYEQPFALVLSVAGLEAKLPQTRGLRPGFGVILGSALEAKFAVLRFRHREAETLAFILYVVIVFGSRGIFHIAGKDEPGSTGRGPDFDRVELLAAVAAKMNCVETVVWCWGIVLLAVEPQRALILRLGRAVEPSGPADELIKLEGEEWAVVSASCPLLLAETGR